MPFHFAPFWVNGVPTLELHFVQRKKFLRYYRNP